jgi:hypothetical protein
MIFFAFALLIIGLLRWLVDYRREQQYRKMLKERYKKYERKYLEG